MSAFVPSTRFVVGLLLVSVTGCSFMSVTPPPSDVHSTKESVQCTESAAAPAVDALVALPLAVLSVAFAVEAGQDDCASSDNAFCFDFDEVEATGAVITGVPAALYGASAAYGFATTYRCREFVDGATAERDAPGYARGSPPQLVPWTDGRSGGGLSLTGRL